MLDTVQEYIDRTRALLQDKNEPYRYPDDDIIAALNTAMLDARRIRPDLFRDQLRTGTITEYTTGTDTVEFDIQYRASVVYYMVGHIQMIDEEDVSDSRAASFMNMFTTQLLSNKA